MAMATSCTRPRAPRPPESAQGRRPEKKAESPTAQQLLHKLPATQKQHGQFDQALPELKGTGALYAQRETSLVQNVCRGSARPGRFFVRLGVL